MGAICLVFPVQWDLESTKALTGWTAGGICAAGAVGGLRMVGVYL